MRAAAAWVDDLGGSQLPQSFQKEGATHPKQGPHARAFLSRSLQRPAPEPVCAVALWRLCIYTCSTM